MKESIITLMEAAGCVISCENTMNLSLSTLLEQFQTGTQKRKQWGRPRQSVKSSAQGPIQNMSFACPATRAKDTKKVNTISAKSTTTSMQVEDDDECTSDHLDNPLPLLDSQESQGVYLQQNIFVLSCSCRQEV